MHPVFVMSLLILAAAVGSTWAQLVRLSEAVPAVAIEARYFGTDNFIGSPIDGYEADEAMLTPEAADALARAAERAAERGFGILVYDAYRPQRAVDHFVRWGRNLADTTRKAEYYPDVPKAELFDRGYIAERSGHSRGSTVDLTLTREGEPLEMGTPFDFFDELSHTGNERVPERAMANRMALREIMTQAGFRNYVKEWWHYTLVDEPYPNTYFDIPVR